MRLSAYWYFPEEGEGVGRKYYFVNTAGLGHMDADS